MTRSSIPELRGRRCASNPLRARGSACVHEGANHIESADRREIFSTLSRRLAYYPAGLVRSAPLLLPLLVILAVLGLRQAPQSRLLTALVTLHFGLFYVTSLLSRSVGAFTERFMFAFVVALAPLLGMLPALIARARHWPFRAAVTGSILALLLIEAVYGLTHRLDEWGHSPDLLEVTSLLGDLARGRGAPLRVFTGDGFESDLMPLAVQNGRRPGGAGALPLNSFTARRRRRDGEAPHGRRHSTSPPP